MRDGSPEAVRVVAEGIVHSPDESTRSRAVEALRNLKDPPAIDVVCSIWAASRHPRLSRLVFECDWVASAPARVRALTALRTRNFKVITHGGAELIDPLVETCWDTDPELAGRARQCLLNLKNQKAIDALCARWVEKREELLSRTLEEVKYLAGNPPSVRVLSALKLGQTEVVTASGAEVVEPLIEACLDLDPKIAERARFALGHLRETAAQEAVCRRIIESDQPAAREVALAARYSPRDPADRALFYFLTEQWEQYEGLDFDQRLLRATYEKGSRKLRSRIAEKARRTGRTEWIQVIAGGQQDRHVHEMIDEEWEATLVVLAESRRWPETWRLAQAAPADWSVRFLSQLQAANWRPPHDHERAGYARLLELAGHCREEPPFLGRLMRCAAPLAAHSDAICGLAVSPSGQFVASASHDHTVRAWNLMDGSELATFNGHTDWISCLTISRDGRILAAGSCDRSASLWNFPDGTLIKKLEGHSAAVRCLALTPDGRVLATGSDDATVRLWRVADDQPGALLAGHSDIISCLAVSPDGRVLASGSYDNEIRLWSLPDGSPLATWPGHKAMVNCLTFSPDGSALASGSKDRSILIWRLTDGAKPSRWKGHRDDVSCLAISPDGSILASGSWDTTVRLWRFPSGEPLDTLGAMGTMDGHSGWVTCIAFSPDGRVLASGGLDNSVWLWSCPGGAPLRVLEQHQDRITGLSFTPDGRTLVTGSWDRTVCLWKSELARLRRLPLGQTTLGDLEWAEQALFNSKLSEAERAWLEFLQAMIQWRRRFDVQLSESERIPVGEFDIEIEG